MHEITIESGKIDSETIRLRIYPHGTLGIKLDDQWTEPTFAVFTHDQAIEILQFLQRWYSGESND